MLTFLAIKGVLTLLATKGVAILAVKSALAFGVAVTVKGLLVTGVVVGGVKWTEELVNGLKGVVDALEQGNEETAIIRLARLARKIHGADLDNFSAFPDEIDGYLKEVGVALEARNAIVDFTRENQNKIRNVYS